MNDILKTIGADSMLLASAGSGEVRRGSIHKVPSEVAARFEAVLLQQVVRAMRSTVHAPGSEKKVMGQEIYDHLMEEALASHMARAGGMGLQNILTHAPPSPSMTVSDKMAVPAPEGRSREVLSRLGHEATASTTGSAPVDVGMRDDGQTPLSRQLPPDSFSWLNDPRAHQVLRDLLENDP